MPPDDKTLNQREDDVMMITMLQPPAQVVELKREAQPNSVVEIDRQLFDDFTELGSDPEMCDISFAFEAQSEVALRD